LAKLTSCLYLNQSNHSLEFLVSMNLENLFNKFIKSPKNKESIDIECNSASIIYKYVDKEKGVVIPPINIKYQNKTKEESLSTKTISPNRD